jgi:hypothetical protein
VLLDKIFLQKKRYHTEVLKNMFLFLAVWINLCSAFAHPLYVSVTNMDIDTHNGRIALSIRIFTEDLETVLHNKYNVDGWLGTDSEHRDGRRLLGEYVNERFSVAINGGEKLNLTTDSITVEEDAMWFYMRGSAGRTVTRVEIDNRLLTDFFSKQNNLVIISTGSTEGGHKLDRKNHKIDISL